MPPSAASQSSSQIKIWTGFEPGSKPFSFSNFDFTDSIIFEDVSSSSFSAFICENFGTSFMSIGPLLTKLKSSHAVLDFPGHGTAAFAAPATPASGRPPPGATVPGGLLVLSAHFEGHLAMGTCQKFTGALSVAFTRSSELFPAHPGQGSRDVACAYIAQPPTRWTRDISVSFSRLEESRVPFCSSQQAL